MLIEFTEEDSAVFDEVMAVLNNYPYFEKMQLKEETVLSFHGLEIYPDRRKIYCDRKEINLTVKEYGLLSLLIANKGRVLTYEQIYENVWGSTSSGSMASVIRYHIYHLREKLQTVFPNIPFTIRCVREVGYCFEVNPIESTDTV